MDVRATLIEYAGGSLASLSQGRSLRPLIEDKTTTHREFAVSEFLNHTALITHRSKIEFGPDGGPVFLFDRAEDPLEQINLIDDHRYMGTVIELKDHLIAFRASTPAPS